MKILFALAVLFTTIVAVPKAEILDGTTWALDVRPDAATKELGESSFKETMKFAAGNVSLSLPKGGMKESPYTVSKLGGLDVNFETDKADTAHGDSRWSGTVRGNKVEGKLILTESDGTVRMFLFTGYKLD